MMFACIGLIFVFAAQNAYGANVAQGATATQSSTWRGIYTADRAVDGNTGKTFFQDTCTHTACNDPNPYWTVNLGRTHNINSLTIHNPDQARGRLHDVKIEVFATDPATGGGAGAQLCATIGSTPVTSATSTTLTCTMGTKGQYIRISKSNLKPTQLNFFCDALLLCEVEVDATPAVDCPMGFERNQDSCYYFADEYAESWFNARDACQTMGADLAVIESQDENNFIKGRLATIAGNNTRSFYAGLHKLNDKTTWRWIDPEAVTGVPSGPPNNASAFSDWRIGQGTEPRNHCMLFNRPNTTAPFEWYHKKCYYSRYYICEVSPTFPTSPCGKCAK
ncbi:uncharacterized protein LOC121375929 [Gigantopelta aegis]|uniref:uncharacterized protein LOC121375929 n=1 Tax=Gigantopelta aegis TaxID=1735272 RepID=UPI001B88D683|nr:uncharacterized protein LOC121375929 [Gigantopelta aegis]